MNICSEQFTFVLSKKQETYGFGQTWNLLLMMILVCDYINVYISRYSFVAI